MFFKKIAPLLLSILFCVSLNAQKKEKSAKLSLTTSDNQTISAKLLLPEADAESYPAIILIHQGGSSKKEWFSLPISKQLLKEGYALLAYDIRMHGESSKDVEGATSIFKLFDDPNRAPLDLKAVIDFLKNDKRIDNSRIGIMGASVGANLACVASATSEYNIKSIVVLSAKTSAVQNLFGKDEPIAFKNGFFIASEGEGKRKDWAKELYNVTSGERKIVIAEGSKHGSFILKSNKALSNEVVEWIKQTL
ncbi:alpha/beta hydrolase [Winogradskyella immobilis]|uniref:Alpha/beta fold hydrolase n=1 Tax=Winogradskyella immobilis TaxID=2816852 RepID=A0ABS8EQ68_9FLAO|nr:alpha/beta fold hydrolase [Winogradskyella immobilis]MCC1485151.1 alpha/beta fold hydrolase [Winogradskyella immobilis]MCG0017243.1 alpha/beta fold hydrolase [Winogradskyella immobilis]